MKRAHAYDLCPTQYIEYVPSGRLNYAWAFYTHWANFRKTWNQTFRPLAVFSSEEWAHMYFDCYGSLNTIRPGWTLSVFKLGVTPDWEDRENWGGGRWMAEICSREEKCVSALRWASLYRKIVLNKLCCPMEAISGISYHDRPYSQDKICLWIKGGLPTNAIIQLGLCFKDALKFESSKFIIYRQHPRSTRPQKNLYYL